MSNNTEFKWDDETVLEFIEFTLKTSPLLQGRRADIQQFKESKKPLFITEDKVDVFRGGEVCLLSTDNWLISYPVKAPEKPFKGDKNQFKYFSSKEAANEYILYNKPLLSLQEIITTGNAQENNPYYIKLVALAESKLNK